MISGSAKGPGGAEMKSPLVSVIIPTFRAPEYLALSLPEFLKDSRCEVVVGLDGDNARYRELLEGLPVTLSVTGRRQGACTSTNLAASAARGEFLFLCNDDMVPAPGWLDPLLSHAGPNAVVSATCWEPGLAPAPPPHRVRDFGRDRSSFRREDFFASAAEEKTREPVPGINYPLLIPRPLWEKAGGLDERFDPGSASDPDLFIRLALLEPAPAMVRARGAVFYHFASRSSIFAGGKLSLVWKLHRRHGRLMFRLKWGRMWGHLFGDVPDAGAWRGVVPRPEPAARGRLWRRVWFGNPGRHKVVKCGRIKAARRGRQGRIAIFIWGGLGNAAMALPMVNAVRRGFGDRNVSLALPGRGMECLFAEPERLGRILTINSMEALAGLPRIDISLPGLPYPRWRYGLASLAAGARLRIGDAALGNPLLNRLVDTLSRGSHLVERNLALLGALGMDRPEVSFGVPIGDRARKNAGRFLGRFGAEDRDNIVGFHPGAGNPMRRWPRERFVELGRALAREGKNMVVFAGPGEKALAERVASGIGGKAAAFSGPLPEALAVIARCSAFAAADSGLAHCAAALGVPVLAIMGPSDEMVYRPYGPRVKVITGIADCRPCYRPGGRIRCRHGRRICLDVGADQALHALRSLI